MTAGTTIEGARFAVALASQRAKDALTARYVLTIDRTPGRSWTYGFGEMVRELMVLADLDAGQARGLLFDAFCGARA